MACFPGWSHLLLALSAHDLYGRGAAHEWAFSERPCASYHPDSRSLFILATTRSTTSLKTAQIGRESLARMWTDTQVLQALSRWLMTIVSMSGMVHAWLTHRLIEDRCSRAQSPFRWKLPRANRVAHISRRRAVYPSENISSA